MPPKPLKFFPPVSNFVLQTQRSFFPPQIAANKTQILESMNPRNCKDADYEPDENRRMHCSATARASAWISHLAV